MNKVNHKIFFYYGISLFFILHCTNTSLKIHPDKSGISYSDEIFYQNILPDLKDKSVMIISNPSGIGNDPGRMIKGFKKNGVKIKFFLGLEHGFLGLDEKLSRVPVTIDSLFNLPVYHIYKLQDSEIRDLISQVDAVIFDVQDMGMRCYTYITVMKKVMDQMHGNVELIVLDHINPGMLYKPMGEDVEKRFINFAANFPLPMITGLTVAESALYYNNEILKNTVKLNIVKVRGYSRNKSFEEAGIIWNTPSPNLPLLESARNYFALVLLEGINVSVGRGTQAPFIYFGAPWMDGHKLVDELNHNTGGKYYVQAVYFKPAFGIYADQICKGLRLNITDFTYDPVQLSYRLISLIREKFPANFNWEFNDGIFRTDQLWGTESFRKSISEKKSFTEFHQTYIVKEEQAYNKVKKYYLY